jgi:diguanylate cyclase (GGDEF)-like protein/PAS domain S-box-containing protein
MGADEGAEVRASTSLDLHAMLDLLAQTIVNALGFDLAAVNLVESPDRVAVVAVAGPDEARRRLLGTHVDLPTWISLLKAGTDWGRLVFLDHRFADTVYSPRMVSWTPDFQASDDPHAWHPDDSLFAPLRGSNGQLLGVLSVDLPIGGRRPGEETRKSLEAFGVSAALAIEHATLRVRAEESEELFREVFSASPLGMALLDDAGAIVVGNAALCRFLERTPSELAGHLLSDFRHPGDARRESDERTTGGRDGSTLRFIRSDGSVVFGEVTQTLLHGGTRVVTQVRDVTEQRDTVSRLQHLATHDVATGVGNRSLLLQRLRTASGASSRTRDTIALLFVDLDGFKRINDDFSHAVGDQVLRAVAQRLLAAVRPDDTVVRWGGDEFIVMLESPHGAELAVDLAERIGSALSLPVSAGDDEATITCSIGVACRGPDDSLDIDDLLRNADTAMYRAKRERKSSFAVFSPEQEGSSTRARHLRRLVGYCVERGRIEVHYQPVVAVDNGAVRGVEALMRLRDDDGELLYPAAFLSTARETADLASMELYALRQACQQVAGWSAMGFPLGLSVNVETSHLHEDTFAEKVLQVLAGASLPTQRLTMDMSERSLAGLTAAALRTIRALVDAGVTFGVDDFSGGGYSLSYLRTLPLRELKIERAVLQRTPADKVATAVVRAHATLAHELGLRCVATGVETREQHEFLRSTPIVLAQGFLYEEPVRAEALTEFLHRNLVNAWAQPGQQPS